MFEQPAISRTVARILGMLTAVDLYDEPLVAADKVNHVLANWLLANEFMTVD